MRPKYVIFQLTEDEYISLGKMKIKKDTGLDLEPMLVFYEGDGFAYLMFEGLSDEDDKKMLKAGYDVTEIYQTTFNILENIFETNLFYASAPYEYHLDEGDDINVNIEVDYDEWLKLKGKADFLLNRL